MKLAISNIAWSNEEEPEVAKLLQDLGVKYIELAPTKRWQDPTNTTEQQVQDYLEFWKGYGIEVVAFQSMLFSRPDLKLFVSEQNRNETKEYLKKFISLATSMGAGRMVFGSPKNRQCEGMTLEEAWGIAKEFFAEIGQYASAKGVEFCIEPNAEQYACDFVTNALDGTKLVKDVDTPGFGLHLDIACMFLAGDNIVQSIEDAKPVLKHFHISAPMLGDVPGDSAIDHEGAAQALKSIGYDGFVSIEMRLGENTPLRVETAVRFAQSVYGN